MGAIGHRENPGQPSERCAVSRYQASARLSVAPMMDWTDTLQRRCFPGVWYANGAGFLWKR